MIMNAQRERLIKLINDSGILCRDCGEYAPSYCAEALADELLAKGVLAPPCKVGDTVYWIADEDPDTGELRTHVRESEYPVNGLFITADDVYVCYEPFTPGNTIMPECDKIGTTFAYLTEEEAKNNM